VSKQTAAEIPISVELRLRYLAPRVHRLGEAPLFHLLRELAAGAALLPTVERYAALPSDLIRAYRGDRLPPGLMVVRKSS
jgi:hypothetical protein